MSAARELPRLARFLFPPPRRPRRGRGPGTTAALPPPTMLPPLLLALLLLLPAALLPSCARAPRRVLPPGLTLGEFRGPGGEAVRDELRRLDAGGPSGGGPVLSGETDFRMEVEESNERVVLNQDGVPWPEGLPGRENETPADPGPWETGEYPLSQVAASLTLRWTLADPASGAAVDSGVCEDNLRRSFGGFLGSLGLAGQELPAREDVLALMVPGLAEQLVEALGPAYSAADLAQAFDGGSRQAAALAGQGDWDGASRIWLELLARNPDYSPALYNMGLHHERLGDPDTAWAYYRLAYVSSNTWANRLALTRLADSLERLGRPPRAAPPRPF